MEKVKISKGNSKMGKIWNISLPPVISCTPGLPCIELCYALKAYRMYSTVREAWNFNLRIAETHLKWFFHSIDSQLKETRKRPSVFRFHVAGDILNQEYLDHMKVFCKRNGDIKFLAFTKKYKLKYSGIPENLNIVFSAWPGLEMVNRNNFPVAYMKDKARIEDRIPPSSIECSGNCSDCLKCFYLDRGDSVYFHQH
jgi:hypothetical protein